MSYADGLFLELDVKFDKTLKKVQTGQTANLDYPPVAFEGVPIVTKLLLLVGACVFWALIIRAIVLNLVF